MFPIDKMSTKIRVKYDLLYASRKSSIDFNNLFINLVLNYMEKGLSLLRKYIFNNVSMFWQNEKTLPGTPAICNFKYKSYLLVRFA